MTPTDVDGWIRFAPIALVACLLLLGITALLENTDRGRDLTRRAIDWIVR